MEQFPGNDANKDKRVYSFLDEDLPHLPQSTPESSIEGIKEGPFSPLKQKLLEALSSALGSVVVQTFKPVLNAAGLYTGREKVADLEKFHNDWESFERISNETGDYFSGLIPGGIHKPEDDIFVRRNDISGPLSCNNTSAMSAVSSISCMLHKKSEYREEKRKALENTMFGERVPFDAAVDESETPDDVSQMHSRAIQQGGNVNLVYEMVENLIDRKNNSSEVSADLILQNALTGQAVSLNSLLPNGWKLCPAHLGSVVSRKKDGAINLKDAVETDPDRHYFVARSGPGASGFLRTEKKVLYEDLSKKGNVLTLFHEVAHAWQMEYDGERVGDTGESAFKKFYKGIYFELGYINALSYKKDLDDFDHKFLKGPIDKLRAKGVELYYDGKSHHFWRENPVIEEGVVNVKFPGQVYVPVRSERLAKLLNSWVYDERDAWAHALKVMRFLREKGIDIAPELTNLEEIKAVIDPCLESYQEDIESLGIGVGVNDVFLRRPSSTEI